ncbi:MAG: hypothetical protein GYA87_10625 [Christensenellaceae bacterium]|nr:hypothetical protein [Christensenellaceae bacterium]
MNFGEILSSYEHRTGATINRAHLANLIDEAQVEIAKRYGKIVRQEYYSVDVGEGYALPLNHLQTEEVRDGNNKLCADYEITPDGKIYFPAEGDYVLVYTTVPDPVDKDNNDSELDVHQMFHGAVVQYCVAKWWEDHSEGIPAEEAKSDKMMNEFYRKIDESAHVLRQRAFGSAYLKIHPIARGN